jgi:hypothetical protein
LKASERNGTLLLVMGIKKDKASKSPWVTFGYRISLKFFIFFSEVFEETTKILAVLKRRVWVE